MNPKKRKPKRPAKASDAPLPESLRRVNLHAAGIDIGATEHWVAVPPEADAQPVRCFGTFTADLHALADWLKACGVTTVAMESTGVYWIALFQTLETRGFQVLLVNARHVKNVPGRKSDVLDCQWLQELHTFGLLRGSFRPEDQICVLRAYWRHRDNLVKSTAAHIQHMQKALLQMNLQLHHVISDVTGVTGLAIIRAIIAGERDPQRLAAFKDHRIKASVETIAKALEGDYRAEHLFVLQQALALHDFYSTQIDACDRQIEAQLRTLESKVDPVKEPLGPSRQQHKKPARNEPVFDLRGELYRLLGVDLTTIPGIQAATAQTLVSELGCDLSRWKTEKHFASWLGLCPGTKITGGQRLTGRTRHVVNRAATALRLAAQAVGRSKTALGAFYRRLKSRLGAPKANTATAHKLARMVYRLLKFGQAYVERGEQAYEQSFKNRLLRNLHKQAANLGYHLVPQPMTQGSVS
jgi:transposase